MNQNKKILLMELAYNGYKKSIERCKNPQIKIFMILIARNMLDIFTIEKLDKINPRYAAEFMINRGLI